MLTNTAAPVHVADVIVSIGRMLKAKLTIEAVSAALGYAELEIKRLATLSDVPGAALEALVETEAAQRRWIPEALGWGVNDAKQGDSEALSEGQTLV